jgi:addiction module RelE/StbE family toxin
MGGAIADLGRLHDFLNAKAPGAALRMRTELVRASAGLSVFPQRGRIGELADTREYVLGDYVMIYRIVDETTLHIVRVFHGREKR